MTTPEPLLALDDLPAVGGLSVSWRQLADEAERGGGVGMTPERRAELRERITLVETTPATRFTAGEWKRSWVRTVTELLDAYESVDARNETLTRGLEGAEKRAEEAEAQRAGMVERCAQIAKQRAEGDPYCCLPLAHEIAAAIRVALRAMDEEEATDDRF